MPVLPGVDRHRAPRATIVVMVTIVALASPHLCAQSPGAGVVTRPLGRDIAVYQPAAGDPKRVEAPPVDNPTGTVALGDALALALLHHPGLAAFAWEIRAREARALQAGRRPNPWLNILTEDFGSGSSSSELGQLVQPQTTLQLSQLIELGGKRSARQQLADRSRNLAAWDYEAARIDVLTEVSRTFTDVLAAQEAVTLTDETTRLVEQVQQSVAARVAAGVVSPIEETRATVALAAARADATRARRMLEASRMRLALLWGSPAPAFQAVVGDLKAEPPPLPPLADIAARVEQSPDLARWAAEMAQREAALAVERSKGAPDVSVVAGYRRFTDVPSNAFIVGASVSLPFFDRNKDGILEARSRLAKVREERRAAQARVAAALADAYAALAIAHDEALALRSGVLPGSQQTFEAVSEGYRLGRFGFLDVLDAQRTLVSAGSQYLRALADYHKAVANVERLIGAPLTGSSDQTTIPKE